jgi:Leucine-rich repeat (LRR) protein
MKKWIKIFFSIVFIVLVISVMSMSKTTQSKVIIEKPNIYIENNSENAFLTEDELYERLLKKNLVFDGQKVNDLKIADIEDYIKNMSEVKKVDVYSNLGSKWNIHVEIRKQLLESLISTMKVFI